MFVFCILVHGGVKMGVVNGVVGGVVNRAFFACFRHFSPFSEPRPKSLKSSRGAVSSTPTKFLLKKLSGLDGTQSLRSVPLWA